MTQELVKENIQFASRPGIDLKFDLYIGADTEGKQTPVVFWFHSGGLVNGSKGAECRTMGHWLKDGCIKHGWAFITADYRLLLPGDGHMILDDLLALHAFLKDPVNVKEHLPVNTTLDLDRSVVSGASCGGYLSYLWAVNVEPRPRAVLSLFGQLGDAVGPHWTEPQTQGIRNNGGFTTYEDVAHLLGTRQEPIASAPIVGVVGGDLNRRGWLYNYWLCHGLYLDFLTGQKGITAELRALPHEKRLAAIPEKHRRIFPQYQYHRLPPTFLIHGAHDTSVPLYDSIAVWNALEKFDIPRDFLVLPNAEHGLRALPDLVDRVPEAAWAYAQGIDWIKKYI